MTSDQLPSPEKRPIVPLHNLDLMSHRPHLLYHLLLDALLQEDRPPIPIPRHLLRSNQESWRIKRLLWVMLKCQHVKQNLDMALRLHEASHDAVDGV